jgi:plasmid stabilization system protein ParE
MKYQFHPDALEEYREAALWYSNRERELALRFTNAIEETVRRIVENPERWRVVEEDVRRCLTRIFPFAILYTIEPDFILIVAVMHWSREPGYWRERLDKP